MFGGLKFFFLQKILLLKTNLQKVHWSIFEKRSKQGYLGYKQTLHVKVTHIKFILQYIFISYLWKYEDSSFNHI